MPYFVFRISPEKRLALLDAFEGFQDAKAFARARRAEAAQATAEAAAPDTVKMCHAPSEAQARALLLTEREPRPLGEDA